MAAAAALALAGSRSAAAHIQLTAPRPRVTGLKAGPCGEANSRRSENICEFQPGATIVVTWNETVEHPGHFRISFDDDGDDDFADPAGFDDTSGGPAVLVDDIADRVVQGGDRGYSREVPLPDMECDNCTLQVIQVMSDKPPYGDGNDIYYQCADLVLSSAAPADPADGCAPDSGGDGSGDAGGGDGGGEGGCAAARSQPGWPSWPVVLVATAFALQRRRRLTSRASRP